MKSIKIFLASSDELSDDRNAFGNLVRKLDNIYTKRGIHIELFEWEDYDAAYNNRRKQDEYNNQIKAADMFLALFHTKAGEFTIEEFGVATEEFRKHASPKVYVYCKDLQPGEQESQELAEFKRILFHEMGHYWSRYNNRDSMQLHFVMQLQLVENSEVVEKLKLENGTILLERIPIARMENLKFASSNEGYMKMSTELAELPNKIEKARQRVAKFPDDEDLRDDLQQRIDQYNNLKEEFHQLQNALFETAQRIASMQLEHVSELLRRAIVAFEDGNIEKANVLLDEIAHEADQHMAQLDLQRTLVHQDIEAFQLQAKTIMADASIPIKQRIERTSAIYAKADNWAEKSAYDKEKYANLLCEYAHFLYSNAYYDQSQRINLRLLSLYKELYGENNSNTASAYFFIGTICESVGNYTQALEYHFKALRVFEAELGPQHPCIASSYNNLGIVYIDLGDYSKALEFFHKGLSIVKELGSEDLLTVNTYNNIGLVYSYQGDYQNALDYYSNALSIQEIITDEVSYMLYKNIGEVYYTLGDYSKAMEYLFIAMDKCGKELGLEHPTTAGIYNGIGTVYHAQGNFSEALEYFFKALDINKRKLGEEHSDTADSYNNVAGAYYSSGDYAQALEYNYKALAIKEKVFGTEHPDIASYYNNIGNIYNSLGDFSNALQFYFMALDIKEKFIGLEHPSTALTYYCIGQIYDNQEKYSEALEFYFKALNIRLKVLGTEHPDTADSFNEIGWLYCNLGDFTKAKEYCIKALEIRENTLGLEHIDTASSYNNLGMINYSNGDFSPSVDYFAKALVICEKILGTSHPYTNKIKENLETVKAILK